MADAYSNCNNQSDHNLSSEELQPPGVQKSLISPGMMANFSLLPKDSLKMNEITQNFSEKNMFIEDDSSSIDTSIENIETDKFNKQTEIKSNVSKLVNELKSIVSSDSTFNFNPELPSPIKKLNWSGIGKETAKKRLKAFSTNQIIMKKKVKLSNTFASFDNEAKDTKKSKKKVPITSIQEIINEETRFRDAMPPEMNHISLIDFYDTVSIEKLVAKGKLVKEALEKKKAREIMSKKKEISKSSEKFNDHSSGKYDKYSKHKNSSKSENTGRDKRNSDYRHEYFKQEERKLKRYQSNSIKESSSKNDAKCDNEKYHKVDNDMSLHKSRSFSNLDDMQRPVLKSWYDLNDMGITFDDYLAKYPQSLSVKKGNTDNSSTDGVNSRQGIFKYFPRHFYNLDLASEDKSKKSYKGCMILYTDSKPSISYAINPDVFGQLYMSSHEIKKKSSTIIENLFSNFKTRSASYISENDSNLNEKADVGNLWYENAWGKEKKLISTGLDMLCNYDIENISDSFQKIEIPSKTTRGVMEVAVASKEMRGVVMELEEETSKIDDSPVNVASKTGPNIINMKFGSNHELDNREVTVASTGIKGVVEITSLNEINSSIGDEYKKFMNTVLPTYSNSDECSVSNETLNNQIKKSLEENVKDISLEMLSLMPKNELKSLLTEAKRFGKLKEKKKLKRVIKNLKIMKEVEKQKKKLAKRVIRKEKKRKRIKERKKFSMEDCVQSESDFNQYYLNDGNVGIVCEFPADEELKRNAKFIDEYSKEKNIDLSALESRYRLNDISSQFTDKTHFSSPSGSNLIENDKNLISSNYNSSIKSKHTGDQRLEHSGKQSHELTEESESEKYNPTSDHEHSPNIQQYASIKDQPYDPAEEEYDPAEDELYDPTEEQSYEPSLTNCSFDVSLSPSSVFTSPGNCMGGVASPYSHSGLQISDAKSPVMQRSNSSLSDSSPLVPTSTMNHLAKDISYVKEDDTQILLPEALITDEKLFQSINLDTPAKGSNAPIKILSESSWSESPPVGNNSLTDIFMTTSAVIQSLKPPSSLNNDNQIVEDKFDNYSSENLLREEKGFQPVTFKLSMHKQMVNVKKLTKTVLPGFSDYCDNEKISTPSTLKKPHPSKELTSADLIAVAKVDDKDSGFSSESKEVSEKSLSVHKKSSTSRDTSESPPFDKKVELSEKVSSSPIMDDNKISCDDEKLSQESVRHSGRSSKDKYPRRRISSTNRRREKSSHSPSRRARSPKRRERSRSPSRRNYYIKRNRFDRSRSPEFGKSTPRRGSSASRYLNEKDNYDSNSRSKSPSEKWKRVESPLSKKHTHNSPSIDEKITSSDRSLDTEPASNEATNKAISNIPVPSPPRSIDTVSCSYSSERYENWAWPPNITEGASSECQSDMFHGSRFNPQEVNSIEGNRLEFKSAFEDQSFSPADSPKIITSRVKCDEIDEEFHTDHEFCPFNNKESQQQSSGMSRVIRVGNVLQVLPQESPEKKLVPESKNHSTQSGNIIEVVSAPKEISALEEYNSPDVNFSNRVENIDDIPIPSTISVLKINSANNATEFPSNTASVSVNSSPSQQPKSDIPNVPALSINSEALASLNPHQQALLSAAVAATRSSSKLQNPQQISQLLLSVLQQVPQQGTNSTSTSNDVEAPAFNQAVRSFELKELHKQRKARKERKRREREKRRSARKVQAMMKKQEPEPEAKVTVTYFSDEEDDAIIKEAITEVPDFGSPIPDYEIIDDDEDEEDDEPTISKPVILPPPDKGILMGPSTYSRKKKMKFVSFADGVIPGHGSSASEGEDEEIHSTQTLTENANKEKESKKSKKKEKVRVKAIRQYVAGGSRLDSPPPPPESPPAGNVLKLYPGCTHYTCPTPGTFIIYAQQVSENQNNTSQSELVNGGGAGTITIPPGMLINSSAVAGGSIASEGNRSYLAGVPYSGYPLPLFSEMHSPVITQSDHLMTTASSPL